jgi:hypothetical protein
MSDVVLSPQTVVLVGTLLTGLVTAIVTQYRQALKDRDRLLDEVSRDRDEKAIRIIAVEGMNERLQVLTVDAMAVARLSAERLLAEEGRARQP